MGQRLSLGIPPVARPSRQVLTPMLSPEDMQYVQQLMGMAPKELQDANFTGELAEGEGRKTTGQVSHSTGGQSKTTLPITRDAYDAAIAYINENPPPALDQMRGDLDTVRGGIQQLGERYLRREKAGHNLNVAPLASLVDAWTGSNFAQNYVPAGSEMKADIMRLGQLAAQGEIALTAQERQLLDAILGDQQIQQLRTELGMGRVAQEGTSGQGINPVQLMNHELSKLKFEWQQAEAARKAEEREKEFNRKVEEQETKEKARQAAKSRTAGIVVQDLGRAMELLDSSDWSAGPLAGRLAVIPGTPAYEVAKFIESIKANIRVDQLQEMREASPTGGALGNVSNFESQMLGDLLGSLDLTQPKETVKANMQRIYNDYLDIIHGPGNGPERYDLPFDAMGKTKKAASEPPSDDAASALEFLEKLEGGK